MLTKFSVVNYKQFKNKITFDLLAGNYGFNEECIKNKMVKTALIYGENASGKSNLGYAMFDLVEHLTDNSTNEQPKKYYLNADSISKKATFTFDFIFNYRSKSYNITYEYSKDNSRDLLSEHFIVDKESVIHYEKGKPFFSQLENTEHLNKTINPEQNLSALKYIYNNSNLDSRQKYSSLFSTFMSYVNDMLWFRAVADGVSYTGYRSGTQRIETSIIENNNVEDFEKFLNDSGVKCKLSILNLETDKILVFTFGGKIIPFFSIASTGTKSLALFYYWWQQIKERKIPLLFIDEFDASYHFALSKTIVNKLKELENTQVILTTHNTNLLNNDLIRPDCGFIINGKSIKALQHCTEKELRYAHNLEKLYKAGVFNV